MMIPSTKINTIYASDSGNMVSLKPSEMCKGDYGCDRNVCWRSCDRTDAHGKNRTDSWCYTKSKPEAQQYHKCKFPHDCSPCWDCLGVCNIPKK